MDDGTIFNDYYILYIIIFLVFFAISIALSFYFIFVPSRRAADQIDNLFVVGQQTIDNITNLANTVENLTEEIQKDSCDSIIYLANAFFIGTPGSEACQQVQMGNCNDDCGYFPGIINPDLVVPAFCLEQENTND